ncbi:MAG: molybdate ABC transporter permease subunit [Pseudoxanthomonas suwonensis]|nr:molybdate ABC transporter permease subunit [Pseudoxanthomonas suwonensis]
MADWMTPEAFAALRLSLRVALVATLAGLPLALACAWWLERRRFVAKPVVEALVQLPMVVPPVVPGLLLLLLFGSQGPLGRLLEARLGLVFAFDWKGAALAALVMAFPLMLQPIRLALRLVDARLEAAASTLGASPWRVFVDITLPLAVPGLVAGAVLGFCRSLGEFGATMAFVGNIPGQTRTLPLAIYSLMQTPGGTTAALGLSLLSIALAFLALLVVQGIGRRLEQRLGHRDHRDHA